MAAKANPKGKRLSRAAAEAAIRDDCAATRGTLLLVDGVGYNGRGGVVLRKEWEPAKAKEAADLADEVVAEAEAATAKAATEASSEPKAAPESEANPGPNSGSDCDCGRRSCDHCGY